MTRKLPIRDPIAAHQRKTVAARRVGQNAECACGESRPEALIPDCHPPICASCDRKERGQATLDRHHVSGKSNSSITIPVPVNDHRARLTSDQYDWPSETLENLRGSPLLVAAASLRGYSDTSAYLVEKFVLSNPEVLETLDAFLIEKFGPKWWIGTPMERYARKQ